MMAAASDGEAFSFKNLCGGVRIQLTDYQLMGISVKSVAVRGNDGEQVSGIADVNVADGIDNNCWADCAGNANGVIQSPPI